MAKSRVLYALILLLSFGFLVFQEAKLSVAVFLTVLFLPALSFLYLLAERALVEFRSEPREAVVERGGTFSFEVYVKNRSLFPFPAARLTLFFPDFGGTRAQTVTAALPGRARYVFSRPADCAHRGEYRCGLGEARLVDLLCLFSVGKRVGERTRLLVVPRLLTAAPAPDIREEEEERETKKADPASSGSVVSDIRGYRPGDRLKAIHWKLSSRQQEGYVVRLYEPDAGGKAVVAADLRRPPGDPGAFEPYADAVVELALGLARSCVLSGRGCRLCWYEAAGGAARGLEVGGAEALDEAALRFGTAPAYEGGPGVTELLPDGPGDGTLYVVTACLDGKLAETLLERVGEGGPPIRLIAVGPFFDDQDWLKRLGAAGFETQTYSLSEIDSFL